MDNKGFTLVEILAVIVILTILAAASFTVMDAVNKRNLDKASAIQKQEILEGASMLLSSLKGARMPNKEGNCTEIGINSDLTVKYIANGGTVNKKEICKVTVTVGNLIDAGILDYNDKEKENLIEPASKKVISRDSTIEITFKQPSTIQPSNYESDEYLIKGSNIYKLNLVLTDKPEKTSNVPEVPESGDMGGGADAGITDPIGGRENE